MKYTLLEEYDYDFTLIGISCHAKDYRICWSINQRFGYDFEKQEHDLEMLNDNKAETSVHSLYAYYDDDNHNEFFLISNRNSNGYLIPEQRHADYMLMVKVAVSVDAKLLSNELKEIDTVLTAFQINVMDLKSRKNLIF